MIETKMPTLSPTKIEKGALILRAIANPVRLKILQLLGANEELTVSSICDQLKTEQSSTSHHLINMRMKGILTSRRSGKNIFYALKEREILKIMTCLDDFNGDLVK